MHKQIFKKIKQYDEIVIARHIGPDPDALASQIALRDAILATFPNKKVYAVGSPAARFSYFGKLDKTPELDKALLIALDVPDIKRIDGYELSNAKEVIKIDHHPFIVEYANIEWINDKASSTAEMISDLIFQTRLILNKSIAEKLVLGIVADSQRFLFTNNSPQVFEITAKLLAETNLDLAVIYEKLYERTIVELRFQSYIGTNFNITENGLAYIYLSDDILKKYQVDPATAGNMINNFNYIKDVYVWMVLSDDKANGNIRGTIRSRKIVINDIASQFGGGGHEYASGVRLKEASEIENLIAKIEKKLKEEFKTN